jgi:hypothetical protein
MSAKDSDLAGMMMWQYNYSWEMSGTISANEDEIGRSITVTKIVDGNTVIFDEIKFEDNQKKFVSIEIMADEKTGFIRLNLILPCNTSKDSELDILKRVNNFNYKFQAGGAFYNTEKQRYEYQSSIGFAGFTDDFTEDPIKAISFKHCRDQACLNWMLDSLRVASLWLRFVSNE